MSKASVRREAINVRGLARAVQVGERVFLRYPTREDRREFMALKRASRRFLAPWEGTPPGLDTFGPRFFARMLKNSRNEGNQRFVICSREDGRIAGQIGLSSILRGPFQSCFVGYWIGEEFAGRGYMTEALGLVLVFAFQKLGLHRVEANIVPRNKASKALVKRLGFRYEGTAKRYLMVNHRWEDHEHWAMTVD